MADMKVVLEKTLQAIDSASDEKKVVLATKLVSVMQDILTKVSSFSDIPEHFFENTHPAMEAQIKAVEDKTEHAADAILTAAENIGGAVKDAPDEIKAAVQKEVNAIFEASNFQDLVSQHANEIRLVMKDVKADMTDIKNLVGGEGEAGERSRNKGKREDDHLLNGPAV